MSDKSNGIVGGGLGAIIFFIGVMFLTSADTSVLTSGDTENVTPFFIVAILMFTFVSTTISGILIAFLTSLVNKKTYTKLSSVIFQIFFLSIVVFLLSVPVYFVEFMYVKAIPIFAILIHMVISVQISILVLEVRGNTRQSLIAVYSSTLMMILSAIIVLVLKNMLGTFTVVTFILLPLIAGVNGFVYSIVAIISRSLSQTYDKDFLSITEDFGHDYGVQNEVEEEVEVEEKAPTSLKDGADFLREEQKTNSK